MSRPTLVALIALLALVSPQPTLAAGPKALGQAGFWNSYSLMDSKQPVCYMTIKAKPPAPKKGQKEAKRGEVVLMITHRPGENSTDVVSYTAGLKFKQGSELQVKVGGKEFSLFTQGDTAWSHDAATDHALAQAIRAADQMDVTGTAASGMALADTLHLKGAAAAYATIGKACGLKVEEPKKPTPEKTKAATKKKLPLVKHK
jgi:hypothetical protein